VKCGDSRIAKPLVQGFSPLGAGYAAFVLDPDGHNVEAVYHGPGSRNE
jgi:hypothetical protein